MQTGSSRLLGHLDRSFTPTVLILDAITFHILFAPNLEYVSNKCEIHKEKFIFVIYDFAETV